jgi:DNA-binding transcriptional ArsR family regulator
MSNRKANRFLSDPELENVAAHFRLMGEPMRLKILQAVCRQRRTVTEIVEATGATQANISRHLALLSAGGILSREKAGQFVYYGLKDPLTLELCKLVHSHHSKH